MPLCIAKKREVFSQSTIVAELENFGDDHILEQCTTQGVGFYLFRLFDTQQIGGETRIVEIELGRFYEPLVDIREIGGKAEYDKKSLQQRYPFGGGFMAYAGILGKM